MLLGFAKAFMYYVINTLYAIIEVCDYIIEDLYLPI